MLRKLVRLCVLAGVALFAHATDIGAQESRRFPVVTTSHLVQDVYISSNFLVSNDARFFYQPGIESHFIWDIPNQHRTPFFASGIQSPAGWSASGRYFALAVQNPLVCEFGEAESLLIVFDAETLTRVAEFCIPLYTPNLHLAWLPFDENTLLANEMWWINWRERTMRRAYSVSARGSIVSSCADYRDYQYLWSEETQKPNAVIKLDKEQVENEDGQTVVGSAVFSLCPMGRFHLPCEPLVDVNANHAGDFVFGWLVSSRR